MKNARLLKRTRVCF